MPIAAFLVVGHRARGDRVSSAVGKSNHDTEQIPASRGLTKNVVHWILAFGFRPKYQRLAEARFFDFLGLHAMAGDVSNSIIRPDELSNLHHLIVPNGDDMANNFPDALNISIPAVTPIRLTILDPNNRRAEPTGHDAAPNDLPAPGPSKPKTSPHASPPSANSP